MKKLITLGLYGLLVFGASGASAWYFHSKATADAAAAAAEPEPTGVTPKQAVSPEILSSRKPEDVVDDEESPLAVRPKSMSVEEIVRLGLSLKSREQSIKDREEAFRKIESRHQLVLADIEAEQKEIDGMVTLARDQRLKTVEILKEVRQRQIETEKMKQEAVANEEAPRDVGTASDADVAANLKAVTAVVQSMTPDKAADVLKQLTNDGKMDMAVKVVAQLDERKAAGILEALDDEKLAGELLEKFSQLKRPTKEKKGR